MQKATDATITEIDQLLAVKEKEILTVYTVFCVSMFPEQTRSFVRENRFPLFRIMLLRD